MVVDDAEIKVMIAAGMPSPVFTFTPAFYFHVTLPKARLDFVDPTHNSFVHVIGGQLEGRAQPVARRTARFVDRGGDLSGSTPWKSEFSCWAARR